MLRFDTNVRMDSAGAGNYGARRGSRTHLGIDLIAAPEMILLSPVNGIIVRFGYPYADSPLRLIEVRDVCNNLHRFFYVAPKEDYPVGTEVVVGDPIGIVQDVTKRYPGSDMKNHVHYEIRDPTNNNVDPEQYYEAWDRFLGVFGRNIKDPE